MANFARTQLDAVWISGYQAPPSDYEDLDRKQSQGLNGVVGGCYAPTSPIVVGGVGLRLTTTLEVRGSGLLQLATGASLVLSDNDYQDLAVGHPGRTRSIYQAMAPATPVGANHFAVANVVPTGAIQTVACSIRRSTGTTSPEFVKRLRVHNGATLARLRIRFKVPTLHPSVPQRMPRVRVFRVRTVDGVAEDLCTTVANDGFVDFTTPNSGTAWHAGGVAQEFVVTPDKNHVIDDGTYSYFAHFMDEVVGVPSYPLSVKVYEGKINVGSVAPNASSGFVDTFAQPLGKLALFRHEDPALYNGVWVSPGGAGPWTRVADLSTTSQFSNGMLFYVGEYTGGQSTPGTVWQLTVSPDFQVNTSPVTIQKPVPAGTMFLGILTEFENIVDTRLQ